MSNQDARAWAAALSPGDCELIVHGALRAGDTRGVVEGLKLLATKDPRRAQELFEIVKTAVDIAKSGPEGRAGIAAELRTIAGTVERSADGSGASAAGCVFCAIVAGTSPANVVAEWSDAIAIVPHKPVVDGHVLVIPKTHVADFADDPEVTAATMRRVAQLGTVPANVITSAGESATQTVFHLHVHIVPRSFGDRLALPWTGQQ